MRRLLDRRRLLSSRCSTLRIQAGITQCSLHASFTDYPLRGSPRQPKQLTTSQNHEAQGMLLYLSDGHQHSLVQTNVSLSTTHRPANMHYGGMNRRHNPLKIMETPRDIYRNVSSGYNPTMRTSAEHSRLHKLSKHSPRLYDQWTSVNRHKISHVSREISFAKRPTANQPRENTRPAATAIRLEEDPSRPLIPKKGEGNRTTTTSSDIIPIHPTQSNNLSKGLPRIKIPTVIHTNPSYQPMQKTSPTPSHPRKRSHSTAPDPDPDPLPPEHDILPSSKPQDLPIYPTPLRTLYHYPTLSNIHDILAIEPLPQIPKHNPKSATQAASLPSNLYLEFPTRPSPAKIHNRTENILLPSSNAIRACADRSRPERRSRFLAEGYASQTLYSYMRYLISSIASVVTESLCSNAIHPSLLRV